MIGFPLLIQLFLARLCTIYSIQSVSMMADSALHLAGGLCVPSSPHKYSKNKSVCVCVCVCVCNVSSMLSRWVFSLQRRASLLLWQDRKGQSTGGKLSSTAMRASHFVLNRSQKCTDKQTAAVHRRPRFTAESEREISACLTTMILL